MANRLQTLQADPGNGDVGNILLCDLFIGVDLMSDDVIEIKSQAKRNVLVSVMFGAVGLGIASIFLLAFPESLYYVGIFLTSASLVAFLVAWVKFREPQFSFLLSKTSILYQHKNGQWQVSWHNIQRIDVPSVNQGVDRKSLDMVAIKIKDYSVFLSSVSPRLMTNILMEQRPLLFHNMPTSKDCATGGCYSDDLLEDDYFKDQDGKEYCGIQAMFANRMLKLRERLGYDIFISVAELDRPEQEFVSLLRQCHQRVVTS